MYKIYSGLLEYVKPILVSSVLQFFSGHMFIYAMAYFVGLSAAGEIGAARNIFGPLIVLFIVFDNLYSADLLKEYKEFCVKRINSMLYRLSLLWGAVVFVVVSAVYFYKDHIVAFIYGTEYVVLPELILWFCISHVLMSITKILSIYLRSAQATRFIGLSGFVSFLMTVSLVVPLVYYYSYQGAMIVMLLQQVVLLIIHLIGVRSTYRQIVAESH